MILILFNRMLLLMGNNFQRVKSRQLLLPKSYNIMVQVVCRDPHNVVVVIITVVHPQLDVDIEYDYSKYKLTYLVGKWQDDCVAGFIYSC